MSRLRHCPYIATNDVEIPEHFWSLQKAFNLQSKKLLTITEITFSCRAAVYDNATNQIRKETSFRTLMSSFCLSGDLHMYVGRLSYLSLHLYWLKERKKSPARSLKCSLTVIPDS